MISCCTASVDETQALGGAVAGIAEAGDVIVLVGDLGAGKTAFVQGFAAALGVTSSVTSPTFTLANRYEGMLVVNHFDVYRFEHADEVRDLALPEIIDEGVALIEWGDMILHVLPDQHLVITIRFGGQERSVELYARGETWRNRLPRLDAALAPWA